jgi:hypothetical protein
VAGEDGFVAVHVTTDPVEGELMVEVLGDHEIDARLEQVNGALMGAGQQIFQTRVEVPEADAVRARQLLEDLGDLSDLEQFSEPADVPADAGPTELRREGRLGAGVGLIVPGAGHFRARWPWTTGVLVLGILACLVLVKLLQSDFKADLVFVALFTVPVCDALGARRLMRADVKPGTPARQIGRGLGLLGLASLIGTVVAGAAALPGWLRDRHRGIEVACSPRDLIVRNLSDGYREVNIARVGVGASGWAYAVATQGLTKATLAPGEHLRLELRVPASIVEHCLAPDVDPNTDCWLLTFLDYRESPTEPVVDLRATCTPAWNDGAQASAFLFDPKDLDPAFETFRDAR